MSEGTVRSATIEPARWQRRCALVLALLFAAHLLQSAGPLRLEYDAIESLTVGASAADGNGFLLDGRPFVKPVGYPALVAALDLAGLGRTWAIVLLSDVLLGLGLWAAWEILQRAMGLNRVTASVVCGLTLLSHLVVKFAALPTTDVPFTGVSFPCLLALVVFEGRRDRWLALAAAILLIGVAMTVRKVGVILVCPLVWVLAGGALRRGRLFRLMAASAGLAAAAASVAFLSTTEYFGGPLAKLGGADPAYIIESRLAEIGSLALNLPESRVPDSVLWFLRAAGAAALGVVALGFWSRRGRFGCVDAFVLPYLLLLCVWPFHYARFWLPVLPLLIGYGALAVGRSAAFRGYLVAYAAAGIAALGYSTLLTFAAPGPFADGHSLGVMKNTYRAAFGLPPAPDGGRVNARAVRVLKRFEPRAAIRDGSPPSGRLY